MLPLGKSHHSLLLTFSQVHSCNTYLAPIGLCICDPWMILMWVVVVVVVCICVYATSIQPRWLNKQSQPLMTSVNSFLQHYLMGYQILKYSFRDKQNGFLIVNIMERELPVSTKLHANPMRPLFTLFSFLLSFFLSQMYHREVIIYFFKEDLFWIK